MKIHVTKSIDNAITMSTCTLNAQCVASNTTMRNQRTMRELYHVHRMKSRHQNEKTITLSEEIQKIGVQTIALKSEVVLALTLTADLSKITCFANHMITQLTPQTERYSYLILNEDKPYVDTVRKATDKYLILHTYYDVLGDILLGIYYPTKEDKHQAELTMLTIIGEPCLNISQSNNMLEMCYLAQAEDDDGCKYQVIWKPRKVYNPLTTSLCHACNWSKPNQVISLSTQQDVTNKVMLNLE